MLFKGRTVAAFILVSVFASCLITLTLTGNLSPVREEGNTSTARKNPTAGLTQSEIEKLDVAYQLIENKYVSKVDREKVLDGAVNGMLSALGDPYSVYMDAEEAKSFEENVDSTFSGIGAEVSMDDGKVIVIAPIKNSPAERAGIRAKDVILSVNGESLAGLKLNDAVKKLRGQKGSQAKLQVMRGSSGETMEIIVVRDDVDIETVYGMMLDNGIGKIEIRQFSLHTADRFSEELANLEAKGMKGLIIDVRNNPGGYLYGVLQIIEPLVPKGKPLIQIQYGDGQKEQKLSNGPGKPYPIMVLTNKGSASASEILAGALKQSAGATLVGETTFGKGTVQNTFQKELKDGSNIKMTIAKWLTPNGTWIHQKGIAPDIKVEQPSYFSVAPLSRKMVLSYDTTGDDVKNLQIMLNGLGLKPGRSDGYYDEKTESAVKAFQRLHDLPATGKVDEKTADQLEAEIVKKIVNPVNDAQLEAAVKQMKSDLNAS